jgi:hypothetical protein
VGGYADVPAEAEVTFPPGTSFRVLGFDHRAPKWFIELEEVGNDE